jgi:mRNA interferase MazF
MDECCGMARRIARGEIWMYEFRRPDKVRPVVVLTRDEVLESMHSVLVAPVTSTIRGLPSEVRVGTGEGLKCDSAVNLDHISSVERAKLARYVGSLDAGKMRKICGALQFAVGCD